MSRFSVRKSYWLWLSLLVLAATSSSVSGQIPLNVTAWAGPISPDWTPAPTDQSSPASATLGASVNNPPVAPYPCTLEGPDWEWGVGAGVLYSQDNITWTSADPSSYTAWIVQPDPYSSAATFYVLFYAGGYWQFPCNVGVSYDDSPCGDTWFGTTSCTVKPAKSVELLSLTVIAGATQTNVVGGSGQSDWAAVKETGAIATAQATTMPNNEDAWAQIVWSGGDEGASANQRNVDKSTSEVNYVIAQIGSVVRHVNIWVIWANVTIQVGGKLANDNNAEMFTDNNGNWRADLGGGNALGAIDHDAVPGLTYAYTIGKIQATGKLTPPGIGRVISTTAWKFKRTREDVAWDNGGHYTNPNNNASWAAGPSAQDPGGTDDTSAAQYSDLDPTSGGSVDTIYDVDAPGCSTILGTTIYHTSETYVNFTQFVTVTLDAETTCSDNG